MSVVNVQVHISQYSGSLMQLYPELNRRLEHFSFSPAVLGQNECPWLLPHGPICSNSILVLKIFVLTFKKIALSVYGP